MFDIRPAQQTDLEAITEIYNQAILRTTSSFDVDPKSIDEQQEWFAQHDKYFPIFVATLDKVVIGWISLSKWSDRCGYSSTAEVSLYVHEKHRGKGYGRKLLNSTLDMGRKSGIHTIIARIVKDNEISLHLFEQLGFEYVGTIKEVGKKFGELLDVVIMQLIYQ
jgi:phosphinothricin acetyltransferase